MTTTTKNSLGLQFDPFGIVYSYLSPTDKMALFSSHRIFRENVLSTMLSEGNQTILSLISHIPLATSETHLKEDWIQFTKKATKPGYFVILTGDNAVHPIKELSACKHAVLSPLFQKLRTLSLTHLLNLEKRLPKPTFFLINSTKNQLLNFAKALKNQELTSNITGEERKLVVREKIVIALAGQGLPLELIFSILPMQRKGTFLFTAIFKALLNAGYIYRAKAWLEDLRNSSMKPSKKQELLSFHKDLEQLAKELSRKQDNQGAMLVVQRLPLSYENQGPLFFALFKRLSCFESTTLLVSQFGLFKEGSPLHPSTSILTDGSFSETAFETILAFTKASNPKLGHIGPDFIFWALSRSMTQKGLFQEAIELANNMEGINENTEAVQEISNQMIHLKTDFETLLRTFFLISNPTAKLCFALKLSTAFPVDFEKDFKKIIRDIFAAPDFQKFPLFLKQSEIESDSLRNFLVNFFRNKIDLLKEIQNSVLTMLVLTDLTVIYIAEKNLQNACKMAFYIPNYRQYPHLFLLIAEGFLQNPIGVLEAFWGNPGLFTKDKQIHPEALTTALNFNPRSLVLRQLFHLLICNALLEQGQWGTANQVLCQLGKLCDIDPGIYSTKLYALVVTKVWEHLPSQGNATLADETQTNPLEFYINLIPKNHLTPHLPSLMKNGDIKKAIEFVDYETNNETWNLALLETFNFHLINQDIDKAISILNRFNNHVRNKALSYLSSYLAEFHRGNAREIVSLAITNRKITQEEGSSILEFIEIFEFIKNETPLKAIQELSKKRIDSSILSSICNLSAIYLAECNQIDKALEFAAHILPESPELGNVYEVIILKTLTQHIS